MKKTLLLTLLLAAPLAAQQSTKVTPLITKDLANIPGKEVRMVTVEFPPGGSDPAHRHDAYVFVYVLEGSVVMGVKGGNPVTLTPGQTFYEGPEDIHTIARNASKTEPAKFLAFLLKDKSSPASIPVK
jgi:quercetin dioxygenase-like cupin family protein